jgi:HD-like signal output (HDOD) protein
VRTYFYRPSQETPPVIDDFRGKVEGTINFLPPLPAIMSDLIEALNSEDADFRSLGKIISRDPSMTLDGFRRR